VIRIQFTNIIILFTGLFILSSCRMINPVEDLPPFINLQDSKICLNDSCTDIREHGLKAVWVFREGLPVPLGIFGPASRFPLPDTEPKKLFFRAGVFENGISSMMKDYPFMQTLEMIPSGIPGKTDTLFPLFQYFPDSVLKFPVNEGFENQDIQLEFFRQPNDRDSSKLERVSIPGFAYSGNTCAHILLDPSRQKLELSSIEEFDLPPQGANVWLEIAYRGSIPLQAGLVANRNGFVSILNQNTIIPKEEWTILYLNFTPLASANDGSKFKLWLGIDAKGESGNIYIDRLRLIHFK
jgi:hypothetical protein